MNNENHRPVSEMVMGYINNVNKTHSNVKTTQSQSNRASGGKSKVLLLLIIIIAGITLLSSCSRRTNITNERFDEIVNAHSDILDARRSAIYFMSSAPTLNLDLYLNANSYNVDTISVVRDDLMQFLREDIEEILENINVTSVHRISIRFLTRNENRERETFYGFVIEEEWGLRGWNRTTFYNRIEGFGEFVKKNPEAFQALDNWDSIVTAGNGVGFFINLKQNVTGEFLGNMKLIISEYLNSEQFNKFIEEEQWLFIDENFNVSLFFVMPNGQIREFISFKATNFTEWESLN